MAVGSRIELRGLRIEVTDQTSDLRIAAARFRFDAPLEDPRYRFLAWERDRYRPFVPPAVGSSVKLAPASLPYFARYAVSAQNPGLGGR
jgi:hypothetical protein